MACLRYVLLLVVGLAGTLLHDGALADDRPLVLAEGAASAYAIYSAPSAPAAVGHAARELARFLEQITGAEFPLVHDRSAVSGPLLVVGWNRLAQESVGGELQRSSLGSDGFEIHTSGENLYFVGGSPRGTLYAVYYFLEEYLGCRWYSSEFSVIPDQPTIRLAAIHVREVPRFHYREVFSGDADDPAFSARNRLNGQLGHRIGRKLGEQHGGYVAVRSLGIFRLVPPKIYRESHPEYYGGGQLRFGNEAVRDIATAAVKKQLAKWPQEPYYLAIPHADRGSYYRGGKDGELIEEGGAPSAAYVDFVRFIAEAVQTDFPHVTVLAQAYLWSRKPPTQADLPDNMGVMSADIEADFSEPLSAAGNRDFLEDLDGWARLTEQILVWDYITNFAGYLQPHPNLHVLGPNVRALAKRTAVEGVFEQGSYGTEGGEFAELRAWVLAKLLWDPYQDAEALIAEFIQGYYGPAAPYIQEYIHALHASAKRHHTNLAVKTPPTVSYLSAELLRKADGLFAKAEQAAAGHAQFLRHVKAARIAVDYAVLMNRARLESRAGGADDDWAMEERLDRFARYLELAKVSAYREGGSTAELLDRLSVARHLAHTPPQCRRASAGDCIVVQEISFRLAGDARIVADASASDGAAARMAGDSPVWGIQLPLEQLLPKTGKWTVWITARAIGAQGKDDAPAMRLGIYPGVKRQVRLAEVQDGQYHAFRLSGRWKYDEDRSAWIAPPNSDAIEALYIDRIFAVKQGM
ncbi:MAG: DUF4838 domain-containing protein [Nitrococcus sp.]|nr:DUF4838 domain-containing protein [Nitrococcus sp.]